MKTLYILIFSLILLSSTSVDGQVTETFNSSGSWEVPCGVTSVSVQVWGAGGGGVGDGVNNSSSAGYGGGGGGYSSSSISVTPGAIITYTVGGGGFGGNASNSNAPGGNGGSTTFSTVSAGGGTGGTATSPGVGGTGSIAGAPGSAPSGVSGGAGGAGANGGGTGGAGGIADGDPGVSGAAPGGGGGGSADRDGGGEQGGNGGNGRIIITYTEVCPSVNAGTNSSNGPFIVCDGASYNFNTTGFVLPCPGCSTCVPELMYAIYDTEPPANPLITTAEGWTGSYWTGSTWSDTNVSGTTESTLLGNGGGTYLNSSNTVWFVPVTADDGDNDTNISLSHDQNNDNCYVAGTPIQVTYLEPLDIVWLQDCAAGTLTATFTGGYPQFFTEVYSSTVTFSGGSYTVSGASNQIITITGIPSGTSVSITITDDGNGCAPRTETVTTTCSLILPITISSLKAKEMGNHNFISWTTASELNNQWHIVEKSADGISNWTEVDRVSGSMSSDGNRSYEVIDHNPFGLTYYRIHSIDYDGFEEFSDIVYARSNNVATDNNIQIVPNPTSSHINVLYYSSTDTELAVTITDASGRKFYTEKNQILKGENAKGIDVSNLTSGLYFLQTELDGKVSNKRFVKY